MCALNSRVSWMENFMRLVGPQEPVLEVVYQSGEVVSPTYQIEVMPQGKLLALPVNTAAVFTPRNGEPKVYSEGVNYLRGIGLGMHYFNCVNLQIQHIRGLEVKAASQDAWDVVLRFDILWRVRDVLKILRIRGTEGVLISNVLSAASDLVRSMLHDELVRVPKSNCRTVSSEEIAARLLSVLNSQPLAEAVEVLGINVLDRQGDRRRTDLIQMAIVERTEIEQNKQLAQERTDLEATRLAKQESLLEQKRTLAVREAQINCERIAAEEEARLARAKIARQEAESLYEVRMKDVQIQNLAAVQQQEHEREMKEIECRSNLVSEALRTLAVSTSAGLTRPMDPATQQALIQVLRDITGAGRAVPIPELGSPQTVEQPVTKPLLARVLKELTPFHDVPGVCCEGVRERHGGMVQTVIDFRGVRFFVVFAGNFPQVGPGHLLFSVEGSTPREVKDLPEWVPGMGLINYLWIVFNQVKRQAATAGGDHNNGHVHEVTNNE